jgi:YidC/Oxa1 family membrane protein insertase
MFQTLIVQPLYNLLVAVYGLIPGHDLGLSLIIFTVFIRLALWPLLKKQLHQSKKMRDLQPELAKVKKAAAGDKQKEAALMMELYKEKGISPFGSIGLTLIQLPLFLGVFQAARDLTQQFDKIHSFTYSFVRDIPHVSQILKDSSLFNYVSLGFIDLSKKALQNGAIYWPMLVLGAAAVYLTYVQSKQILPERKEKKKLRDVLKASANGAQPAQEDMTAAMGGSMLYLMPILTGMFVLASQGAMVVYLLASSAIGIFQQSLIFKKDTDEMEGVAEVVSVKKTPVSKTDESKADSNVATAKKARKGKVVTKTRIIAPSENSQPKKAKSKGKKRRRK